MRNNKQLLPILKIQWPLRQSFWVKRRFLSSHWDAQFQRSCQDRRLGNCFVLSTLSLYRIACIQMLWFLILNFGKVKVYALGDTALQQDFKLVGEVYKPDIAFIPIGGRANMNIDEAIIAAGWLNPQIVVPIHYDLFTEGKVDPLNFKTKLESATNIQCKIMLPWQAVASLTSGRPWAQTVASLTASMAVVLTFVEPRKLLPAWPHQWLWRESLLNRDAS